MGNSGANSHVFDDDDERTVPLVNLLPPPVVFRRASVCHPLSEEEEEGRSFVSIHSSSDLPRFLELASDQTADPGAKQYTTTTIVL